MYTGIVRVPKATLYESPAKETVSDELLSGWPVTITQQYKHFFKVITHYNYSGWLRKSSLLLLSETSLKNWTSAPQVSVICRLITDVLQEPKVQAPVLSTLFMGSSVLICDNTADGWTKIKTADGTIGYVPSISLPCKILKTCSEQETREAVLSYAMSFLGTQYRWGGKTAMGLDCSGLTFMSYYMCGIIIYRDAVIKEGFPVREIPLSQIKPADLLYFPVISLFTSETTDISTVPEIQKASAV